MNKTTLKTITSVVSGAEIAVRFLPKDQYEKPIYRGALGVINSLTGLVALSQVVYKKNAFNKDNRLNTAIILCLGTASILQGVKKIQQAYAERTEH